MAITLPSTDPVDLYYRPLEPGRLILIENTDRPWSVAWTRWYARRKRIPAANIISRALGTTWYYEPSTNQAFYDGLLTDVLDLWDDLDAQGVFLGPGCPDMVNVRNQVSPGVSYTAGVAGTVPLCNMLAASRQIRNYVGAYGIETMCWRTDARGATAYLVAYPATTGISVNPSNHRYSLTGTGGSTPPTYADSYSGVNAESIYLPNQTALDLLGDSGNVAILQGKLGIGYGRGAYTYDGLGPPTEQQENATTGPAALQRAVRYGEAINPANRYRQPIHFQFDSFFDTYMRSMAYLYDQLVGWGYQASYFWRYGGNADMLAYCPLAGAAYTLTDLQEGRVRDFPYHVMIGGGSNLEMTDLPYSLAWQPSAGGGSYMGPSEGWLYQLNGLARGGAGGATNGVHITAAVYSYQYTVLHNLLRGMTWAEAIYYSGYSSDGEMYATGDPLARPFPQ